MKASDMWMKYLILVFILVLTSCSSKRDLTKLPVFNNQSIAMYQADMVCVDGSVPGFQKLRSGKIILAYASVANVDGIGRCKDGSVPKSAAPTSPLSWRKHGLLWHSNDSKVYHQATNSVGISNVFWDVTGSFDAYCPDGWRSVANPDCLDGSQNIVYAQNLPDLTSKFGLTAFGFATQWGSIDIDYFNGLQCPTRPSGSGVRYPVFFSSAPLNVWTQLPAYFPNQSFSYDCSVDGTGRTAVGAVWHGTVTNRSMMVNGVRETVSMPMICGESYWFASPPYNMEKLCWDRWFGQAFYGLFCDSSLSDCSPAPVDGRYQDFYAGKTNITQPSIPTGTSGKWILQIAVLFDDIEGENWSLAPGNSTGMPSGWNANQFLAQIPNFPGQKPQ